MTQKGEEGGNREEKRYGQERVGRGSYEGETRGEPTEREGRKADMGGKKRKDKSGDLLTHSICCTFIYSFMDLFIHLLYLFIFS